MKRWEEILPKSEIRTRGAKLPDFKLHFKIRPSKKEQKVIEKNSLRDSIGYDRRSKSSAANKKIRLDDEKKPQKLEAAFTMEDLEELEEKHSGPPPIRKIVLRTNPSHWTPVDTGRFLAQTADCDHLAQFMLEDEIDGISFMLLNYETVREFWSLTLTSAIRLCQHVESVKLAFLRQFKNVKYM